MGEGCELFAIASTFPAVDSFGFVSTLNQGIPQINLPSLESGRVALPNSAYEIVRARYKDRKAGTAFGGVAEVGLPIDELLKREVK